ncbi:MAG: hypothetical protein H6704_24295 [Myxococcales bacterium]|nr:hypothetical protein [Myxococcales bacterium]
MFRSLLPRPSGRGVPKRRLPTPATIAIGALAALAGGCVQVSDEPTDAATPSEMGLDLGSAVDATAPADVLPSGDGDTAGADMGTVARITAPSAQFLCSDGHGLSSGHGWYLVLRLGYGQRECLSSDVSSSHGEYFVPVRWSEDVIETASATVENGSYCWDDCRTFEGTVTFTELLPAVLWSRGWDYEARPPVGPVASGRVTGHWTDTGEPVVIPFEGAEGCGAIYFSMTGCPEDPWTSAAVTRDAGE